MKIASWNVNSIRARLDHVTTWLKANRPDVLFLQELKTTEFPATVFTELGYESAAVTQKGYNGVAVLSLTPTRAFAIVVNTAPDEFLFIGANARPRFATSADGGKVIVASQDEGIYKNGKWVPGRRINGDEVFGSGLPFDKIGMLRIKLLRVP